MTNKLFFDIEGTLMNEHNKEIINLTSVSKILKKFKVKDVGICSSDIRGRSDKMSFENTEKPKLEGLFHFNIVYSHILDLYTLLDGYYHANVLLSDITEMLTKEGKDKAFINYFEQFGKPDTHYVLIDSKYKAFKKTNQETNTVIEIINIDTVKGY